ncbi:MAG: InlB B-repeat-containing protein [Clostridia bacterium]|nr:InlB B-repeat-containing protein [Clostridia bacterium]
MKKIKIITLLSAILILTSLLVSCGGKSEITHKVSFNGAEIEVKAGSLLEKPSDPKKAPTDALIYTFKGWYVEGTDKEWNFEKDKVTSDVSLVPLFSESARTYTVTFENDEKVTLAYGSLITEPATPEAPVKENTRYIFDGWYNTSTMEKWNFESDTLKGDVTLAARFTEEGKSDLKITLRPTEVTLDGTSFPSFSYTQEEYKGMTLTVTDEAKNEVASVKLSDAGNALLSLFPGKYTCKIETPDGSVSATYNHSANEEQTITVTRTAKYPSTMGSSSDPYKYPSYGSNYRISKGQIYLSSYTYIYLGDGTLTDKVYIEATVNLPSSMLGSMYGIMPACEYGNLSNDANKALAGASDKAAKKLVFGYSANNTLYSQSISGWSGSSIVSEKVFSSSEVKNTSHKLGVLRCGNYYFVFVNGNLACEYYTDEYGKSGYGFALTSPVGSSLIGFSDIITITDDSIINSMAEKYAGTTSVEYDSSLFTMEQGGVTVKDSVIKGIPVTATVKLGANETILSYSVKLDGKEIEFTEAGSTVSFTPLSDGKYVVSAVKTAKAESTLNYTVKPFEISLSDKSYTLRDFSFDMSEVKVSIYDKTSGKTSALTLDKNGSLALDCGRYTVRAEYKSNVFEKDITVYSNLTNTIDIYLSDSYLGGAITLNGTKFYSYNEATETAEKGVSWSLIDKMRDSVLLTSYTYAFQKGFTGTRYYVEGTFDSSLPSYNIRSGLGALLVSHGPKKLADSSDVKVMAAIYGESVILCVSDNWAADKTITLANYTDFGVEPGESVRLGVVRDGTDYYFFVNDTYVAYRKIESVKGECGIGVAGFPSSVEIRKFNYSDSDELIDALIAEKTPSPTSIDIYLIAGQSNASGYSLGNASSLLSGDKRYVYGNSNILYAGNGQSTNWNNLTTGSFNSNRYEWGVARFGQGHSPNHLSAEVGMISALSEYYNTETGRVAGIIKYAHGGTSLLNNEGGENICAGNWMSPSYAESLKKNYTGLCGGLYRNLLAEVTARVAELRAMGFTEINLKGMFWMQGEADLTALTAYEKSFTYFVSDIRRDLGKIMGEDLSDFAFIVGEVSETFASASSGQVNTNKNFIKLQRKLAENIDGVYTIESSKYDINKLVGGSSVAVGTDIYHWSGNDMVEIGKLVGKSILKNILNITES